MKILHVIDYFQPKLGYQETFLAKEHLKMGHEVVVITSDRDSPYLSRGKITGKSLGRGIKGSGFFIEEGIPVWRLKTLFEVNRRGWVSGLERKILELSPDVVFVHGIVNFFALRIARLKQKGKNFKLVYDDHMLSVASRSKVRLLYPVFRALFSRLLQDTANGFVGVTNASRMFMCKNYGIPLERIAVLPLGADESIFRYDTASREKLRSKLNVDDKDTVFIYTGKCIPEKGPHILVDAAIRLMQNHVNIKVMLVGNGLVSYVDEIKKQVEVSNMGSNFTWFDAQPNTELYKYYSASDAGVWPREASISMIEAMSCGLPVIISDTSEVTERVSSGNGMTYRGDDASDLAVQMEKLLDPLLRKEIGKQGRKYVEEKACWKVIARRFLELA